LQGGTPDFVPTFELCFLETGAAFGMEFFQGEEYDGLSWAERRKLCRRNAELYIRIAERYEHSVIVPTHFPSTVFPQRYDEMRQTAEYLRELENESHLILVHGDATYAIPDGEEVTAFVMRIADKPQEVHDQARAMVERRLAECETIMSWGTVDGFVLCSDYCFNSGPFLSPAMFGEFVAPYLKRLIGEQRRMGAYVIKHTDGNIMPIIDQLVECRPHALHSLDPMAGVDIAEVKRLYGTQVAICGNVNCALMQEGTAEEIERSAQYALQYGKPAGGYIFCTSNCVFPGMPLKSYDLMLDIWRKHRGYLFYDPRGGLIMGGEAGPDVPLCNVEAMLKSIYERR